MTIRGKIEDALSGWMPPELPEHLPASTLPGRSAEPQERHVRIADAVFPELLWELLNAIENSGALRPVVAVCGGYGTGKAETAAVLAHYLREIGLGVYQLSGNNYPLRPAALNDAERLRIFRSSGLKGLILCGQYTEQRADILLRLQREESDSDPQAAQVHPWLTVYQREGRRALANYLGSTEELDFEDIQRAIASFKSGDSSVWVKQMGFGSSETRYVSVDMSHTDVLLLDWTHGNSGNFAGVDIPILITSTPAEIQRTERRRGVEVSAFTNMVLEIEQAQLESQADRARIIVSGDGSLLDYVAYRRLSAVSARDWEARRS